MTVETYSPEDKAAFQRVGEFLCWFSMLETKIDELMIRVVGVEDLAGRLLLSYVPFRRKCEFVSKLVELPQLESAPDEKKCAQDTLERIEALHDIRNILAHSQFFAAPGAVTFMKAEKKLLADTRKRISDETFQQYMDDMVDLLGKIDQIAQRIQSKADQNQVTEAMARARFVGTL
jgi:hypothetical protein